MPPSVHKVLIHGSIVIKYALLPIGQLSEEAQESGKKDNLRYREHHSRKSSRINTNSDLIHYLLISSDPLISSLSQPKKHLKEKFSPDVLYLLNLENQETQSSENDTTSNSDSN